MDKVDNVETRISCIHDSLREAQDLFSKFSTEAIDIATGDAGEKIAGYSHQIEHHFVILESYLKGVERACHDHDRRVEEIRNNK